MRGASTPRFVVRQFGVPQNLDELLAAVATEDIGRPQPGLQRMRKRAAPRRPRGCPKELGPHKVRPSGL
jgi:hypothetical protein